jgi:hypothetical protein
MASLLPRCGIVTTLLCSACLLLTACGDPPAEPAASSAAIAGAAKKPSSAAGSAGGDMVAAVTISGADAPVKLQFALHDKPQLNQPVELEFVLQPTRDIDSAQVSFEPNAGVEVASDNPFFSIARTAAGTGVAHKLLVVPKQAGVLSLSAVVAVDLPTGSVARSFSIPIIVFPAKPAI